VRRAVVSREAGLSEIPATIFTPGQAPTTTRLKLEQLMSPKSTVPMDSRYLNIQPPILTPIQVQPYGRNCSPLLEFEPSLSSPRRAPLIPGWEGAADFVGGGLIGA
jgi:hypothetical protein